MSNVIEDKIAPPLKVDSTDAKTQEEFCSIADCMNSDLDCKDCLFDSIRCPKLIFEKWLEQREDE